MAALLLSHLFVNAHTLVDAGAFWMSFAAYVAYVVPELAAASRDTGDATALFLAAWLLFTL